MYRCLCQLPDIKPGFVVAVPVKETKLVYRVVSSNKNKVVKWWGYVLDIYLRFGEEDHRDLPYISSFAVNET